MRRHTLQFLPILILAGCASHPEEAPPKPTVQVKVVKAESADLKLTVHAPAFVFAREQANIASRMTAPIRKLLVRKGDRVTAGQLLAQLDNHDLVAQQDEAAASVSDAQANLQRVTAGTLPTDIERARGQVATTEAALNQAQKFYDRRKQLFSQGAIPQRDLQLSETELAQAKSNYDVAKKSLDLMLNQSRDKDILMARSKVEQAQAHLALIKAQLGFAEIRSSSAGTITEQFMFPGDMAKPDAPIFTVMDLSIAVARVQLPESDVAGVHVGAPCTFTPADGGGTSFAGRISVLNQAVDPSRRTVETWCEIPNPQLKLRGGAFGETQIVTGTAAKSIMVPLAAVQFAEGSKKGIVMVAGSKGTAEKKEVETGTVYEGKVQVKSGINAGDSVIVEGGYGLPEGTQIKLSEDKKQ
jgi:HlyD family secretion protein